MVKRKGYDDLSYNSWEHADGLGEEVVEGLEGRVKKLVKTLTFDDQAQKVRAKKHIDEQRKTLCSNTIKPPPLEWPNNKLPTLPCFHNELHSSEPQAKKHSFPPVATFVELTPSVVATIELMPPVAVHVKQTTPAPASVEQMPPVTVPKLPIQDISRSEEFLGEAVASSSCNRVRPPPPQKDDESIEGNPKDIDESRNLEIFGATQQQIYLFSYADSPAKPYFIISFEEAKRRFPGIVIDFHQSRFV